MSARPLQYQNLETKTSKTIQRTSFPPDDLNFTLRGPGAYFFNVTNNSKLLDGLGRFVLEEQMHLAELIAEDDSNDLRRGK